MKKVLAVTALMIGTVALPASHADAGRWSWGIGCDNSGDLTVLTIYRVPPDTASMIVTSDRRGKGDIYGQTSDGAAVYIPLSIDAQNVSMWLTTYTSTGKLLGTFGFSC